MPLRDDLLNPIPGDNPSGENLRYAPVYDQIKEARREEEAIAQGDWQTAIKKADWPLVIKLCGESIAKKSKDLQLAAWLTEALVRRDGFGGLKEGLDLIRNLLDNYWETIYPELEDGDSELRATPLEWIGSRLDEPLKKVPLTRNGLDFRSYRESRSVPTEAEAEGNEAKTATRSQAIEDGKLTPEEFDDGLKQTPTASYEQWMAQIDASLEAQAELNTLCEEKFGSYAPSYLGLRKSLEELKQTVHILLAKKREAEAPAAVEETPEPEAADSWATEEEAPAGGAPARKPAAKRVLGAEPADKDDAIERVIAVAKWYRQNDYYTPVPYMLVRAIRWGELRAGGAEVDASLLEAPPTEMRQELKRLSIDGDWSSALELAETAAGMPCGRGWLDVQRYAVRACQENGYEAAAQAILTGLRGLLADYPSLPDLSLLDDTATANAETKTWLAGVIQPVAPPPKEEEVVLEAPPEVEEEAPAGSKQIDPYDMAMEAVRSGRPNDAIELLTHEAAQDPSGRGRFRRRSQLAQICMGAGHFAVAYPILMQLAEEIERRKLEEWETPEMMAHPLALLFRCMKKMDVPAEEKQKIYGRVCRLDPMQALAILK